MYSMKYSEESPAEWLTWEFIALPKNRYKDIDKDKVPI